MTAPVVLMLALSTVGLWLYPRQVAPVWARSVVLWGTRFEAVTLVWTLTWLAVRAVGP